jgi:hypothetical protein
LYFTPQSKLLSPVILLYVSPPVSLSLSSLLSVYHFLVSLHSPQCLPTLSPLSPLYFSPVSLSPVSLISPQCLSSLSRLYSLLNCSLSVLLVAPLLLFPSLLLPFSSCRRLLRSSVSSFSQFLQRSQLSFLTPPAATPSPPDLPGLRYLFRGSHFIS